MPNYTARLDLTSNVTSDPFLYSDFANNWSILDGSPGVYVCSSSTHPSWGSGQAGRTILETDTGHVYWWNGTSFALASASMLGNPAAKMVVSGGPPFFGNNSSSWVWDILGDMTIVYAKGVFSSTLSSNQLVVPVTGIWSVKGNVSFSYTGTAAFGSAAMVNGSEVVSSTLTTGAATDTGVDVQFTDDLSLTAGALVGLGAAWNLVGTNPIGTQAACRLSMSLISQ